MNKRPWLCAVAATVLGGMASAATLTWDADTGTPGPQDGGGAWSTGSNHWWGAAQTNWSGAHAPVFGAASGAAGTVTVAAEGVTVDTAFPLTFNAPDSGSYTLTGGTISAATGTHTIRVNANARVDSTLSMSLTAGQYTLFTGPGTLTLGGSCITERIGRIGGGCTIRVVDGGNVRIGGGNTSNPGTQIGYGGPGAIVFEGGTLSFINAGYLVHEIGAGSGGNGTLHLRKAGVFSLAEGTPWRIGAGNNAVGRIILDPGVTVGLGSSLTVNQSSSAAVVQPLASGTLQTANLIVGASAAGGSGTLAVVSNGVFRTALGGAGTYVRIGSGGSGVGYLTIADDGVVTLQTREHTLGYGHANADGTINLNGGTLGIRGGYPLTGGAGQSGVHFNGGTLKPVESGGALVQNLTRASIQAGGAHVDSDGFNVSIDQALEHDAALGDVPDGGLTKRGAGTLNLTGTNTYTGPTRVNDGTLTLSTPCLDSVADVWLSSNATLNLDFKGTNTIGALYIDGVAKPRRVWGAVGTFCERETPRITGPGRLKVTGPPLKGAVLTIW